VTDGDGNDASRDLDWEGCFNARDLGGLPLAAGGATLRGRVVRADSLDRLTPTGWAALWDFGVRTIIDLRREDECLPDVARPQGLAMHRVSWDDYPDSEWRERNGPPGLPKGMLPFLREYPQAVAETARLLIDAEPGSALVHCAGGRDRTGLFSIVLGALVGVEPRALLADYQRTFTRLLPMFRLFGLQDEIDLVESEAKAEHRARIFAMVESVIAELDADAAEKVLRDGGLSEDEVVAVRDALLSHRGPGLTSPVS
jgi:protein-tyrosine phosphatase